MIAALVLAASIHATPGTTYSQVAAEYGVSVSAVEAVNPYPATDIPIGATITIQGDGSAPVVQPQNGGPWGRAQQAAPQSYQPQTYTPPQPAAAPSSGVQGCIVSRESSGNPAASNGDHYGLYQMTPSLWQAGGGSGYSAEGASVAEQNQVYNNIVNNGINGGLSNWLSYDGC